MTTQRHSGPSFLLVGVGNSEKSSVECTRAVPLDGVGEVMKTR